MAIVQAHVTSKSALVCVQDTAHRFVAMGPDLVAFIAVARMEVERENQISAFKHDHLVHFTLLADILMRCIHELVSILAGMHKLIKGLEELVAQQIILCQVPSTSAVLVAPAVLRAREVDPLGVPELVAHEVQVALAAQGEHKKSDHLVQRQATVDAHGRQGAGEGAHAGVHLGIHEPKGQGLVSHNRLIVGLCIGHHLLQVTTIGQRVANVAHVPTLVSDFLQQLDEHVRDGHAQTVVEAETAVLHGQADSGHAAHVLRHRQSARHQRVNEVVGQHEVDVGVNISIWAEVFVVATGVALADTVGVVQHGGNPVEAEAVELILLQPPLDVGEQETQHLVLQVVEDFRVPLTVMTLGSSVGVAVVCAIHLRDAIQRVGRGMGVH
mmetsp:Transcript_126990/g.301597  ORF Transcript_126990/g.301597 Transcript_126990/m.301597 type:complete len:383 (-) Transcript_126990:128-1276(-)